ncbi:MAG TPA: class I SAM-dependent methyltransferase [Candidatus Limnocylindrales bacterium]|nr:class I SAM-dependent methyltransferase [Candidatus Limnocylindrales bacterium]
MTRMARPLPLDVLERALARPEPFAPHDAPFWDDPHIARGMLAAHLDSGTDAASRRPETIARMVAHLAGALPLRDGDRLLDLGCGPGLYAAAFARLGAGVTGIDLSAGSLAYAADAARAAGLAIDYRHGDYTIDPLGGPFDAAILIYLDFGVLPDAPRDRLLDAVRGALRPGGAFVFDVHALARPRPADASIEVQRSDGGFWRPGPHLVVETRYRYGEDLDLAQHAVIDGASITTYRVWDRAYSVTGLRTLLARHGLRVEAVWSDLAGAPHRRSSPTLGVLARRR